MPRRLLAPLVALLAIVLLASPASAGVLVFSDDFAAPVGTWLQGGTYGGWNVVYDGYGSVTPVSDGAYGSALRLTPRAPASPGETHATVVRSTRAYGDLRYSVSVRTAQQLRTGSAPNAWEAAWTLWHYSDHLHFYYFVLKPTGWELGKEDPSYPGAQRFLRTGSDRFSIQDWHRVRVEQTGGAIRVFADGRLLTSYVDTERPYVSGLLGLYSEDSQALFGRARVFTP